MEVIEIAQDIKVFYITANPFPDDVPTAYARLKDRIEDHQDRKYFGISYPNEEGVIIYMAAAEELEHGEAERFGCNTFTIKKGLYLSLSIKNHMKDSQSIGRSFQQLLSNSDIDPKGYCLEWYLNYTDPDVVCMVKLNPNYALEATQFIKIL